MCSLISQPQLIRQLSLYMFLIDYNPFWQVSTTFIDSSHAPRRAPETSQRETSAIPLSNGQQLAQTMNEHYCFIKTSGIKYFGTGSCAIAWLYACSCFQQMRRLFWFTNVLELHLVVRRNHRIYCQLIAMGFWSFKLSNSYASLLIV